MAALSGRAVRLGGMDGAVVVEAGLSLETVAW